MNSFHVCEKNSFIFISLLLSFVLLRQKSHYLGHVFLNLSMY